MRLIAHYLLIATLLPWTSVVIAQDFAIEKADSVLVVKSQRRMYLQKDGEAYTSFRVTFGANPKGHKEAQGDEKTPEGSYLLDWKNPNSKFYKSIHVSYPNEKDKARARELGVDPGGDIMIHGQTNGWGWAAPVMNFFYWTDGCIAVSNKDMDMIWNAIDPGTPIEIKP